MKKIKLLFILLIFAGIGMKAQETGVGIIVGEPTGLSIKHWVSQTNAVDGAMAWSFAHGGSLYLHADYLHHYFDIVDISVGKMPIYWGLGGKIVLKEDLVLGGHVPLGISYIFDDTPLDAFIEIRPGINIFPESEFDMSGGIGIRYYFDK